MNEQRLTRKELVENIRQTMPSDYNEYEKLAFIEKKVADNISFDEKYLWGDSVTKEKIYKLAQTEATKPPNGVKRKLICVTMAELFGYVAQQFGYDVLYQKRGFQMYVESGKNEIFETISEEQQEHVSPIVGLSNGKYIEVDIQDDLARLQTCSRPKAFGKLMHGTKTDNGVPLTRIDDQTTSEAFRKVYQLGLNERFTDEYIMALAAKLRHEGKTPIQMLEIFIEDPKIKKQLENTRCVEANKLYKLILGVSYDAVIDKQFFKDNDRALVEECILSDIRGRKRYSFCIYAENPEQKVFYIYSKKSKRMIKLTQREMQEMAQQVMNVELRGRSSELKSQMISYINGTGQTSTNITEEKNSIRLEDLFVDDEEELE